MSGPAFLCQGPTAGVWELLGQHLDVEPSGEPTLWEGEGEQQA